MMEHHTGIVPSHSPCNMALFQGLLALTFMFMHLRVQIELKLSED